MSTGKKITPVLFGVLFWIGVTLFSYIALAQTFEQDDVFKILLLLLPIFMIFNYIHFRFLFQNFYSRGNAFLYIASFLLLSLFSIVVLSGSIEYFFNNDPTIKSFFFEKRGKLQFSIDIAFILIMFAMLRYVKVYIRYKEMFDQDKTLAKLSELNKLNSSLHLPFIQKKIGKLNSSMIQNENTEFLEELNAVKKVVNYQLDGDLNNLVPLHTEIEYLRDYIASIKEDADPELKINFVDDGDIKGHSILRNTFLPIVNSMIVQGISNVYEEGSLDIFIVANDDHILFKVNNTLPARISIEENYVVEQKQMKALLSRLFLVYSSDHELVVNYNSNQLTTYLKIEKTKS